MLRNRTFARAMAALALTLASLTAPSTSRADDFPNTEDAPGERNRSVIGRVAATGRANTLVSAAYLGNLLDTLRGGSTFTLFAPTDEAFARLPKEDLAALLRDENKDKLAEILRYHVVPGPDHGRRADLAGPAPDGQRRPADRGRQRPRRGRGRRDGGEGRHPSAATAWST
jgi:uncharacterized surface protein with fasciclin (FAS1) repeats